jgi:tetratricopeptide (TPR) repeat protein
MAAVYANKGHLLEKLGKTREAVELYRKALDISPADPLTTMLLRDAERRQELAEDRDRQQAIDRLVDELVQAYQDGGKEATPGDGWTSRPLTLAFLDFQRQGGFSPRAGEAEFVMLSITHALRTSRRVAIVEREVLHKVLSELKLSASDVANSQAGLGQGKVLAARLLATGAFRPVGKAGMISIRLIETETTLVHATALQLVESPDDMSQAVTQIVQNLLHDIRQAYPLRGRIAQMTPSGNVVLDIGAAHGVTTGLVMQVFDSKAGNGVEVHTPVGRIEVTQVQARSAQGRILEQTAALAPGSKAEEVVEP